MELAVGLGDLVGGEAEVVLEPVEEGGLEDAAGAVEGIAGEPDELGFAEAELGDVLHLLAQSFDGDLVGELDRDGAVEDLAGDVRGGEVLPDELEHEELVEVGVEQGADDGVQLPVVVVGSLGEVDLHGEIVPAGGRAQELLGWREPCAPILSDVSGKDGSAWRTGCFMGSLSIFPYDQLVVRREAFFNAYCAWYRVPGESGGARERLDPRVAERRQLRGVCVTQHEARRGVARGCNLAQSGAEERSRRVCPDPSWTA